MDESCQATAPVFELKGLTVRYGRVEALSAVDVGVPGGAIGLLGPNGAGKSTLIKTLLGLVNPNAGSGRLLGYDIVKDRLAIRRVVGYSPETDAHIPDLEAIRFVALAGELSGLARQDAMQRAHEVLDYVGLSEARYRSVDGYSAGMKQRVKLAQAIVHDPKIVFLDEPTNGLDPGGRVEVLSLIRDIAERKGIHVVLSTHLLPDVERVCDRVVVLERGRLKAAATLAELRSKDEDVFLVRFRGDGVRFAAELSRRGLALDSGRDGELVVTLNSPPRVDDIVESARAAEGQLRGLKRRRRSLEDYFLESLKS